MRQLSDVIGSERANIIPTEEFLAWAEHRPNEPYSPTAVGCLMAVAEQTLPDLATYSRHFVSAKRDQIFSARQQLRSLADEYLKLETTKGDE